MTIGAAEIMFEGEPEPLEVCPKCGAGFRAFLRGHVVRSRLSIRGFIAWLFRRPFPSFAVICSSCKEIVGYEGFPPVTVRKFGKLCKHTGVHAAMVRDYAATQPILEALKERSTTSEGGRTMEIKL